ncbi:MAG: MFS transporter [Acidimicrobiales bacterium]
MTGRRERWLGRGAFSRQLQTHALCAAADACFTVSLAGSLFFSVPLTAARPRIVLYLVLTVVPFAIVAPFIGPIVDRYRRGHRVVVTVVSAARGAICLVMAEHLTTLFVYPEALAVLALSKVYSVAKTAMVPRVVENADALVDANSRLSRVSVLAGAAGGGVGAAVAWAANAPVVLLVAAGLYTGAALTATRLPRLLPAAPVARALEYEEVHAPAPMLAAGAMAVLRGAVGFLAFLFAFALREAGEPAWFFGLALAASGAGAFVGTFAASQLRRVVHEEQMLALALVIPAVFVLAAGVQVGRPSVLGAAFSLGMGATVGRQAFDSLIQHKVPDANRGRLFARFETGFQLAWALGALLPVVLRPPTWVGLLVLAGVLITASVGYIVGAGRALGFSPEASPTREWVQEQLEGVDPPLEAVMLLSAEEHAARGHHRAAVIEAVAAYQLLVERTLRGQLPSLEQDEPAWRALLACAPGDGLPLPLHQALDCTSAARPGLRHDWADLEGMRARAICADAEFTSTDSDHVIATVGNLVRSSPGGGQTAPAASGPELPGSGASA